MILTPKALGTPLCSLHHRTLPAGMWQAVIPGLSLVYPCSEEAGRRGDDQRARLDPCFPPGSYISWQDTGPPQVWRGGRAAARGQILSVRGAGTAPANRPSALAAGAGGDLARAVVDPGAFSCAGSAR